MAHCYTDCQTNRIAWGGKGKDRSARGFWAGVSYSETEMGEIFLYMLVALKLKLFAGSCLFFFILYSMSCSLRALALQMNLRN